MHARPPRARATRTVVLALLALTPLLAAVTLAGTGVPAAASTTVTPQIDTGAEHTCVLMTDGTVRCWGRNQYGQLGNGEILDGANPHPVEVVGLTGVTSIATGEAHTCALLDDATVRCWGANRYGQLGNGESGLGEQEPSPVAVADLSGVTAITAGGLHSCAVMADTTVRCWGSNELGQLADGTTTDRATPVDVRVAPGGAALSGVTAITAAQVHTCALLADTTARCWGFDNQGRLGHGVTPTNQAVTSPVQVLASGSTQGTDLLTGILEISAGGGHTCALTSADSGTVRCWGDNGSGQIGDGTTNDSVNPFIGVRAVDSGGISAVSAGGLHTCALYRDPFAPARCWGEGDDGRLGNGDLLDRSTPTFVILFDPIARISSGLNITCTIMADDSVRCWGNGDHGRLGDGETTSRTRPVTVLASGTAAASPVPFSVRVATTPVVTGPAAPTIAVACAPEAPGEAADAIVVGSEVTCTVTGGDPGIDILWRVSVNPVIAEAGVTLDAEGRGTFTFTVPPSADGQALLVELVEWTAPVAIGVVGAGDGSPGGPVPSRVPAGEGPWSGGGALVVLLSLAGLPFALRAAAARPRDR